MPDRGLREVVAAETKLSDIDGQAGRLWYVGYDIHDLAGRTSYEEVVHLLHELRLPTQAELDALTDFMVEEREVSKFLTRTEIFLRSVSGLTHWSPWSRTVPS